MLLTKRLPVPVLKKTAPWPMTTSLPPGSEEAAASSETLAAVSDPFRWEEFYAPVPEVEAARFDKAYDLLNGEEGKAYRESPAWQGSAFEFDNSENKSLEETLNLSACRRLASSNEDITLENLSSARAEESARIKVEYYNSSPMRCRSATNIIRLRRKRTSAVFSK